METPTKIPNWEIVFHRFAGWRGHKPDIFSDSDVTVYCETEKDAMEESKRLFGPQFD